MVFAQGLVCPVVTVCLCVWDDKDVNMMDLHVLFIMVR